MTISNDQGLQEIETTQGKKFWIENIDPKRICIIVPDQKSIPEVATFFFSNVSFPETVKRISFMVSTPSKTFANLPCDPFGYSLNGPSTK